MATDIFVEACYRANKQCLKKNKIAFACKKKKKNQQSESAMKNHDWCITIIYACKTEQVRPNNQYCRTGTLDGSLQVKFSLNC